MPTLLDVHALARGEKSRTRKLRDAFVRAYLHRHPDAVRLEVDLAHAHDQLPEFDEWDVEAKFEVLYGDGKLSNELAARWNAMTTYTDQLHMADVVLISAPMWNFSVPWMLKRWIDAVVQPRLTFEVKEDGLQGLLGGRTGVLLITRDSSYAPGTPYAPYDFQTPYMKSILGIMGISPIHAVIAEPLGHVSAAESAATLERAIGEASALAASL